MNAGFRVLILGLLVVGVSANVSLGQTNYQFRPVGAPDLPGGPGLDGNWYTELDGQPNVSGGTNWYDQNSQNYIPTHDFEGTGERAYIENGGTAVVDTVGEISPGQIVMGSAPGTSGTLEIRSGGNITSRIGGGVNGNITVGSNTGTGTLRVLPGGTISAESSLVQGNNNANLILVGGPTGAAATVTASTASLASNVQVYPNAAFSTTGSGTFLGGAVYTSEVSGNGVNGKIDFGATGNLNGGLVLNFAAGYNPSVGHNWNVLESAAFSGNFNSISSNASLAANQSLVVTQPSVGGGQLGYNISVQEVLVLEVNRDTGSATLKHPGGSSIQMDGYFIGSDAGSLNPANWNKIDGVGSFGTDWIATADRTDNLGELKSAGDATINGGNTLNHNFGNVYNATAGAFGTVNEDLEFRYRRSSDGAQFPAKVVYTGTKFNTLLLQVDPTGAEDAFLRNTSGVSVQIDAYDILSSAGRLTTAGWNSFDEQNFEGANTWLEVDANAAQIGEVNQTGFTTLAPGAALNLGNLYLGGEQDLDFSFLIQGQEEATPGHVMYQAFVPGEPIQGDYNGNGVVDAADYTLWRDNLNAPNEDAINNNGDGGGVTASDYTYWKARFGNTSNPGAGSVATGAVPEPATALLAFVTFGLAAICRRGR
jgi:hypothetical protein